MQSYLNTIWHYCLQREMCVQPDIIISAGTGDCDAVFTVAANWRHFHLLEILLGRDVLCLQDWEWSQFSTPHHHLCLSITTMIVQFSIYGMLTSVSNYFIQVKDNKWHAIVFVQTTSLRWSKIWIRLDIRVCESVYVNAWVLICGSY